MTERHDDYKKNDRPRVQKKHFTIRVCCSQKSCGDHYGKYIWERVCREHGIPTDREKFSTGLLTYEKSQCQGLCQQASNVQVSEEGKPHKQLSYMTPLKTIKLIQMLRQGTDPENLRRL